MTGSFEEDWPDREEEPKPSDAGPSAKARPAHGAADGRHEPSRSDQDLARELRLRPERSPVVRLSRRALATLGGTAVVGVAAAMMLALWPSTQQAGKELLSTDNRGAPEGLNALPRDYSALRKPGLPPTGSGVPQLGPPLPGDLGRPMLNAGAPAPGLPQPGAPAQPDPEAQRIAQERARVAQELQAARASRLFASEARAAAQPPVGSAGAAETVAAGYPDRSASVNEIAPTPQPSESDRKLAFLGGPVDRRTGSDVRVQSPASHKILQAGSVIPAALITGLRSDLPGQIVAQVTQPVYDSPTGRIQLIPQGAKLIGQYDAQVAFGQSRALLVWNRIIFPDGRSLTLERLPGADTAGFAGLQDRVDNHWDQLFKAALLSTILSVGSEAGASNDENSLVQAIRRGSSDAISQIGRQVVGRSLDVRPTITVRPGSPVRVIVTRDLVIEADGG